jgi:hypothetical protein
MTVLFASDDQVDGAAIEPLVYAALALAYEPLAYELAEVDGAWQLGRFVHFTSALD